MATTKFQSELLPPGLLQALMFCLEECRDHLRNGQLATCRQLTASSYLPPVQRQQILPGLQNQLDHYKRSESAIDYVLDKCQQKMRWIPAVKKMTDTELNENHIDNQLLEILWWCTKTEQQIA